MISICMIVKNEEKNLEKSLDSLSKYNYEIVVVDTGSTDNSVKIACKYTDKVFNYEWNDSFSDARNFCISKASNDFILMIDSDEVVSELNKNELEELAVKNEKQVGRLTRYNEFYRQGNKFVYKEKVNRFFSRKYYKYEGSIHEQVTSLDNHQIKTYNIPLEIRHCGYEEAEIVRKDKINRNIKMLEAEIENSKGDPYLLYQLGKAYYMAADYNSAMINFGDALNYDLNINLEYVQDLVECYGYCFLNLEKYHEALDFCNIYESFSKSSDFIFLIALIYMNNAMFDYAIDEFKKASNMENGKMVGVNSFLANYNIAVIYECLGKIDEAVKYYRKCNDYELAVKRLEVIQSL